MEKRVERYDIPGNLAYYQQKYIVIKISGKLINESSKEFLDFVDYVKELLSYDISPVLVVGGGQQIGKNWEKTHPGVPRFPYEKGRDFTSNELLEDGVIPALKEISTTLHRYFDTEIVRSDSIVCERIPELGNTGYPKKIAHIFEKGKIHIVPFLGVEDNDTGKFLNINADEIALLLGKTLHKNLAKVFFLTGNGGIYDNEGKTISLITRCGIDAILNDKHKKVQADKGLYKKIQTIQELLISGVSSLVLTHMNSFREEIESLAGCGTYVIDEKEIEVQECVDFSFFQNIYEEQQQKGNWKQRSEEEISELWTNHRTISVNNMPIGGLSLREVTLDNTKGFLVECLWTAEEGNGIGKTALESITKGIHPILAFSKQGEFFKKMGFQEVPKIRSETGALLYKKP